MCRPVLLGGGFFSPRFRGIRSPPHLEKRLDLTTRVSWLPIWRTEKEVCISTQMDGGAYMHIIRKCPAGNLHKKKPTRVLRINRLVIQALATTKRRERKKNPPVPAIRSRQWVLFFFSQRHIRPGGALPTRVMFPMQKNATEKKGRKKPRGMVPLALPSPGG